MKKDEKVNTPVDVDHMDAPPRGTLAYYEWLCLRFGATEVAISESKNRPGLFLIEYRAKTREVARRMEWVVRALIPMSIEVDFIRLRWFPLDFIRVCLIGFRRGMEDRDGR
jgi:hypothetical protein